VRRLMVRIASDETRHAELAWQIDAWLRGRLDGAGQAELARAHAEALAQLTATSAGSVAPELADALGLPPPVTRALARTFAAEASRRVAAPKAA
jgi:hypothetical protein